VTERNARPGGSDLLLYPEGREILRRDGRFNTGPTGRWQGPT